MSGSFMMILESG